MRTTRAIEPQSWKTRKSETRPGNPERYQVGGELRGFVADDWQ